MTNTAFFFNIYKKAGKAVKSFDEIKSILEKNKKRIAEDYFVNKIGIFGSVVRGEQKKTSDVDILVEFSKAISLFRFLELEELLSELIGQKVDLVSRKALKPHIGENILQEVWEI